MATTGAIRLATFNVQNLFAPEDLGITKSGVALKAVARTLDLMAAQIVALQEVGSATALTQLNELLRQPYPHQYWQAGNSSRGIHLAYLSRLPLRCASHRDLPVLDEGGARLLDHSQPPPLPSTAPEPVRLQRDLLKAEVLDTLGATTDLCLFNVHLKSKANQPWRLLPSDQIRAAEAAAVAGQLAAEEMQSPARSLVLLGDFNDTFSSTALAPLRGLNWSDAVAVDHAALGGVGRLPGTYWPRRRLRIDYALLNAAAGQRLVTGSVQTHASTLAQRGSDHYPVSLDLAMRQPVVG